MKADIVKIKQRNVVKSDRINEVMVNGSDNAYPSRMERIINSSTTAKACAKMYASFLIGNGFEDTTLNSIVVGKNHYRDITAFDLLEKISVSIAYQNGAFIHVSYNDLLQISEINFLKYKNCRFGKIDDIEYSGKVVEYSNWDKSKGSNIQRKDFRKYDIFNTNKTVLAAQIGACGGEITNYKGQVAPLLMNDEYFYPLSPVDVAQDDADTEYQISLFKNGELSRNFFAKYFLKHAHFVDESQKSKFISTMTDFMGAENNGAIMVTQGDISEDQTGSVTDDTFKLEKIEQNINDKLFVEWEKSIRANIGISYNEIPKILIDAEVGVFSQSGESFKQAAKFYNEMTKSDRQKISIFFSEIFKHFHKPIISDFKISTLTFE